MPLNSQPTLQRRSAALTMKSELHLQTFLPALRSLLDGLMQNSTLIYQVVNANSRHLMGYSRLFAVLTRICQQCFLHGNAASACECFKAVSRCSAHTLPKGSPQHSTAKHSTDNLTSFSKSLCISIICMLAQISHTFERKRFWISMSKCCPILQQYFLMDQATLGQSSLDRP